MDDDAQTLSQALNSITTAVERLTDLVIQHVRYIPEEDWPTVATALEGFQDAADNALSTIEDLAP